METNINELDLETFVQGVRKALTGKIDDLKIDKAVDEALSSKSSAKKYRADGQLASISGYTVVQCQIRDGKKFNGNAGAIPAIGAGIYTGHVYTKDIDRLYAEAFSFEFTLMVFYFSILFFDSSSHLLGHFEAGGFSNYANEGGGKGSWS